MGPEPGQTDIGEEPFAPHQQHVTGFELRLQGGKLRLADQRGRGYSVAPVAGPIFGMDYLYVKC